MTIRLLLIAAVFYFAPKMAFAADANDQGQPTSIAATEQSDSANPPEEITHRLSLATSLGLTDQEVVFGRPRNFRAESLNNLGLDPLTDDEP